MATRKKRATPMRAKPKRKANPAAAADRKALEAAKRLSRRFHGKAQVVELSAAERRPLPRYAVLVGDLEEFTYAPEPGSKRGAFRWRHESGDRGSGKPKSPNKPIVVVDPKTRRPAIVPDKSPMRFSSRRGFVG